MRRAPTRSLPRTHEGPRRFERCCGFCALQPSRGKGFRQGGRPRLPRWKRRGCSPTCSSTSRRRLLPVWSTPRVRQRPYRRDTPCRNQHGPTPYVWPGLFWHGLLLRSGQSLKF
jgi:hypothetical protein